MSTGHEKEDELSAVENVQVVNEENSLEYKQMTKRVLWKFDIHILPPLALVSWNGLIISLVMKLTVKRIH